MIGSDNGLAPDQRQAINWTSAGILFIVPLETNFSESRLYHWHWGNPPMIAPVPVKQPWRIWVKSTYT